MRMRQAARKLELRPLRFFWPTCGGLLRALLCEVESASLGISILRYRSPLLLLTANTFSGVCVPGEEAEREVLGVEEATLRLEPFAQGAVAPGAA